MPWRDAYQWEAELVPQGKTSPTAPSALSPVNAMSCIAAKSSAATFPICELATEISGGSVELSRYWGYETTWRSRIQWCRCVREMLCRRCSRWGRRTCCIPTRGFGSISNRGVFGTGSEECFKIRLKVYAMTTAVRIPISQGHSSMRYRTLQIGRFSFIGCRVRKYHNLWSVPMLELFHVFH